MKVGIIGSGMVGATFAYAIMMSKISSDIVLIDTSIGVAPLEDFIAYRNIESSEDVKNKIDEFENK